MLRTTPFFPPNRGKNHIWRYFPDLACGAIFWMTTYKQQFLHSDWLKSWQLIPNQWNFTSATLTHIRFVFFFLHNIKDNEKNLCQDLLTIKNTDLDLNGTRPALCKWATCTRETFLSKTFAKSLNIQKKYERNVWEKSNAAYSLSIRVQSRINHISSFTFLYFLRQYQRQRRCFLSERELKKALRDTLTRAAWLGPSNFWLVHSEHAHASYPGLFFRSLGLNPYTWGGKKEELTTFARKFSNIDFFSETFST